jgi:riboflavin kinase/FMN adenylyltransferase
MPAPAARTALTIGNFDGVHIGHAALVHRARGEVGEGGRVVALAFDPHPAAVLAPGREPPRLTTFEQRSALLRAIGADEVVRLDPASGVLGQEAAAFLRHLAEWFAPTAIVEGPDFRFGRGRVGDVGLLQEQGRRLGFAVHTVAPVEVALTDQSIVRASSSVVRWLLSHGRVRDAAFVLGRSYELTGEVVPGDRRGRTIGVPTANLAAEQTLPARHAARRGGRAGRGQCGRAAHRRRHPAPGGGAPPAGPRRTGLLARPRAAGIPLAAPTVSRGMGARRGPLPLARRAAGADRPRSRSRPGPHEADAGAGHRMTNPTPPEPKSMPQTTTTTDAYTTNTTAAEVAAWLRGARSVVCLTHVKPDGDAVGSTLAIARAINMATGSSGAVSIAECWYAGPMPDWFAAVAGPSKCRVIEPGQPVPGALDPERIVVTDTGAWNQLDGYADWLRARADRAAVLDHHLSGDADTAPRRIVDTTTAAVCQTAADVCAAILGVAPADLPEAVATPLYLGLATDTGWFRHSNVSPPVMRLAGDLLAAGADHTRLYDLLQLRERPARLRLMARALSHLEMHEPPGLAILSLTKRDFDEASAAPGESGGFVDIPQSVEAVRATALLTEQPGPDGPITKISLRTKPVAWNGREPIDANVVCNRLGGGGHARAAGARVAGTLETAKALLLEALRETASAAKREASK